jgi:hypothetical protein
MRREASIAFLVGLVVGFTTFAILAKAEEQKAQLFMVEEIPVFPSKVSDAEAHIRTIQRLAVQYQFLYPIHVYSADDFYYYYSIPIKDFADIDNFYKARMEWVQRMGDENFQSVVMSGLGSYESLKWFIIRPRPDLSLVPEESRLESEGANYRYWGLCYVKPIFSSIAG